MKKDIKKLITKWSKEAKLLKVRARKTWNDLESGKLDQIDSIIYSSYEDMAQSVTLEECIAELEKILLDSNPL